MFLRALQRFVRLAPGPLGVAWAAMPKRLRAAADPFIHPIAAGPRGGRLRIDVPEGLARRRFDVVLSEAAVIEHPELGSAMRSSGHRVFETGDCRLDDLARRERILDAVYVDGSTSATATALAKRLGWRVVAAEAGADRSNGAARTTASRLGWLATAFPTVSVVVVTHSNASLCRSCVEAVLKNSAWPNLDVIVVDNASNDDTRTMLESLRAREPRIQVLHNHENKGFAGAANQGIKATAGEFVVLLNDDAAVAPGWLSRLVARFESSERFGLVCPVTNEANSLARVPVGYASLPEMEDFAVRRAFAYEGAWRETEVVSLFCALTRRKILEAVGLLDERFAVGMFEDDDLSLSLRKRGYDLGVVLDAFVHHVGQASFSRLDDSQYLALWEANRRRFEEKWAVRWHPPRRDSA